MKILYEDKQILVCYKEAGLAVQNAAVGKKDMVSMLKTYLWEQNGSQKEPYLGLVHRLDQPVEGLLVFGKTPKAAAALSRQVSDGTMRKIYYAGVHASQNKHLTEGVLVDYLKRNNRTNTSSIVSKETAGAKKSELEYWVVETHPSYEVVKIHLLTGRHHQIRVQMAGAGMPLLGDKKYGSEKDGNSRTSLALCALELSFQHPETGKMLSFTCREQSSFFMKTDSENSGEKQGE